MNRDTVNAHKFNSRQSKREDSIPRFTCGYLWVDGKFKMCESCKNRLTVVGKVLDNGVAGWVYCPMVGDFDIGGFDTAWKACRYGIEASFGKVKYFEGGDGYSIHINGCWTAFGNTEENAWMAAYKAVGGSF